MMMMMMMMMRRRRNMVSHVHGPLLAASWFKTCMARNPLALSAAGGSVATLLLRLLSDTVNSGNQPTAFNLDPPFCDCPVALYNNWQFQIDWLSVLLGVLIGLALGPVLECIVLLRQIWGAALRRQLAGSFRSLRNSGLYRVI